jgi:CHAD domain-containing protein
LAFSLNAPKGLKPEVLRLAREQLSKAQKVFDQKPAEASLFFGRRRIKKLRALVHLVRAGLAPQSHGRIDRVLRDAGRDISPSRDLAVMEAMLKAPSFPLPVMPSPELCLAWQKLIEKAREGCAAQDQPERLTRRFRHMLTRADALFAGADWLDLPEMQVLSEGMGEAYRAARRALIRAQATGKASDAHDLRKHAKVLRFQIRLVGASWSKDRDTTEEALIALGNLLGHDRDLLNLTDFLQSGFVAKRWRQERSEVLFAWRRHSQELREHALVLATPILNVSPKYQSLKWTSDWPDGESNAALRDGLIARFARGPSD